jgi:hypothetical protein
MKHLLRRTTVVFGAGCFGGLVNSLALWLLGKCHITAFLGVQLAPALSPKWLYPRVVWGGIWGFLFLLPILRRKPFKQGLLMSLGPTVAQLFVIFPYYTRYGTMGMGLGALTPVLVMVLNALWGIMAAFWIRKVGD